MARKKNILEDRATKITISVPSRALIEMKLQAKMRGQSLSKLILKRFFKDEAK
jgi:hypothetical protein